MENWLIEDEDGEIRFAMNESFILFGVGKRACVGQELAKKEIQYALGYLLMNYKVSLWNKENESKNVTLMRSTNFVTAFLDPSVPIKVVKI